MAFSTIQPYFSNSCLFMKVHWDSILICFVVSLVIYYICKYFFRNKDARSQEKALNDQESSDAGGTKYRFRKRDKVLFYSKKVLRKVRSLSISGNGSSSPGKPKMKKRERFLRMASRMLRMEKEAAIRPTKRPPAAFFEPDVSAVDSDLPSEILYMLKNIRVFGHFEAPLFLELCRHIEVINLRAGKTLFQPGDKDDSIYVVQSGRITVYVRERDEEFPVKIVEQGDSVYSLLSILDVLTGNTAPFKTVSAKADIDSIVLKLWAQVFGEIFEKYHESWLRVIQIIVLTLQRVTFTTLHTYLGLSTELTKPTLKREPTLKKISDVQQQQRQGAMSARDPMKAKAAWASGRSVSVGGDAAFFARVGFPMKGTNSTSGGDQVNPALDVCGPSSSSAAAPGPSKALVTEIDEHDSLFKTATTSFSQILGLNDLTILEGKVSVQAYPPGYVLCEHGSMNVSLMYVLSGSLDLSQKSVDDEETLISIIHSNELVGGLAVLTGEPSFYSVKTRQFSRVAMIPKQDFYEIMSERPRVVLNIAHTVVQRLSPFVRSIDFALDLEMCDAGRALYRQGDNPEALYLVLSGRLRSVLKKDNGTKELVEEYGRGDLVGMVELLTQRPRSTTVISVRYTELAKLPEGLLNLIKYKFPQVLTRIIQLLGNCILGQHEQKLTAGNLEALPRVTNLNTIAVMGVSENVPMLGFTLELWHALNHIKPTLRLSSDTILKTLGPAAVETVNEYRLLTWLSQQEDSYPIVLYQCDFELTNWTRRCIRQADCILIVANGEDEPTVGPVEKQLENLAVRAQKELILLWGEDTEHPQRTADWLDVRGWVSSHYHLRIPHRVHIRRSSSKMFEMYERIFVQPVDKFSDFSRLARILMGNSIGLVLGGGGARGAAHMGILKALKESGIPVDIIGGVSIGSFIGGLYCMDSDMPRLLNKAKSWFTEMARFWNKLFDLTYPTSAIFTGSSFNNTLKSQFKNCQIEDLWIPYFNVTTDITSSEMRIHRNGSIWRYCRASMSLAGYFPPVCDSNDGHLLLDGGYVNNLPADVMRGLGVKTIIAVDVGAQDETDLTNYGDSLNGWWVLWKRWMPFTQPIKILNMAEIQSRLAYVSCVRQLEIVKKAPYCYYIRPPIDKYQTLDFAKFEEIFAMGYEHGKKLFDVWSKNGKLDEMLCGTPHVPGQKRLSGQQNRANAFLVTGQMTTHSFTDLAALVSKIQRPPTHSVYLSDVSEESEPGSDVDEVQMSEPASPSMLELSPVDNQQRAYFYSPPPIVEQPAELKTDAGEPGADKGEDSHSETVAFPDITMVKSEASSYFRKRKIAPDNCSSSEQNPSLPGGT